jgi:acyl carrier protein
LAGQLIERLPSIKREGIAVMEQLLEKVQSAFKSAFDIDPRNITIDTSPDDVPAWDSMGHVTLASSLETTFGISFDVDDLMEMENVKEICRVVESKFHKAKGADA